MRDWTRYEEAKRLRDSGLTLNEAGEALGVSRSRVYEMLGMLKRRDIHRAWALDNKIAPPWWEGLGNKTRFALERAGFESREACVAFCADELTIWNRAVVFRDSDHAEWWRWTNRRLPLGAVNEVRAWLGCQPYAEATTAAELGRPKPATIIPCRCTAYSGAHPLGEGDCCGCETSPDCEHWTRIPDYYGTGDRDNVRYERREK